MFTLLWQEKIWSLLIMISSFYRRVSPFRDTRRMNMFVSVPSGSGTVMPVLGYRMSPGAAFYYRPFRTDLSRLQGTGSSAA